MGEALYRKYRSKSLDEIVGQPHITDTLNNALKKGRISHAYLFTGPKGVGKTSIARILAHEINELPYTDESVHLDIIEIDAASNRRIDEIRDLRDKVHIAPTSAKYKVYIIDEVHMLTKEAFNALLKTLEEPPEHVVFILATTEVQKLPETIISRTQRYTFKPINDENTVTHLKDLAAKENITIDDEALQLIAEHGDGSFRDSISLLDQVGHGHSTVTAETIRQILGVPPKSTVKQAVAAIVAGDVTGVMTELSSMYEQGYQAGPIASELSKSFRARALNQEATSTELDLLHKLINVPASHNPRTYLELILLQATMQDVPAAPKRPASVPVAPQAHKKAIAAEEPPEEPTPAPELEKPKKQPLAKPEPAKPLGTVDDTLWPQVLDKLKGQHNTLYGVARMAHPSLNDDTLTLTFNFGFHQRRCNEDRNRAKISKIIQEITGQNLQVVCQVDANVKVDPVPASSKPTTSAPTETPKNPTKSATLESITEVFGGGEVLD